MARTDSQAGIPGGGTVTSVDGINSVQAIPSPITGTGDLQLVNDQAVPGASMYYGTDLLGIKGWNVLPPNAGLISLTYIALNNLISTNSLTPGQQYLINDYQTITTIPGETGGVHFGAQEPLIVIAATVSELEKQAWSTVHTTDLILYDFIDGSVANPGVLIPNGNMGRIIYRESTKEGDKKSTAYDFREVVFYHPLSSYDMSTVNFPIVPQQILVNGAPLLLSVTPLADTAEIVAMFNDFNNFFNVLAYETSPGFFQIFSLDGAEWTAFDFIDNTPSPVTKVPVVSQDRYYTFGNKIIPATGTFVPIVNGNAPASNVYIKNCNEAYWGTVLNNIILGENCHDINVATNSINGVLGSNLGNSSIGHQNSGFIIDYRCSEIHIGNEATTGFAYQTWIMDSCGNINIGNGNLDGLKIPGNAFNWMIEDGVFPNGGFVDLSGVLSLSYRSVRKGYSNLDFDVTVTYTGPSGKITIPNGCGIANVIGASGRIDGISSVSPLPRKMWPIQVKAKLAEMTPVAQSFFVPTLITGVNTGATGQIIGFYQTPTAIVATYQIITFTGDFTGETDITDGFSTDTVTTVMGGVYTFDPLFCQPSVGQNIVLDASSGIITIDSNTGDYITVDGDEYDQVNFYQTGSGSYLP